MADGALRNSRARAGHAQLYRHRQKHPGPSPHRLGILTPVPVFEYRCRQCEKVFGTLVGMTKDSAPPECPDCKSRDLEKLVSKFRRGRTEDQKLDDWADRLAGQDDPESASEARNLVREIGGSMDDDMSDEMEEMFELDNEAAE